MIKHSGYPDEGLIRRVVKIVLKKLKDLDKNKKYNLNVLSIGYCNWIYQLTATIYGRNLPNFSSSNVILEEIGGDYYSVRIGKMKDAKFRGLNY